MPHCTCSDAEGNMTLSRPAVIRLRDLGLSLHSDDLLLVMSVERACNSAELPPLAPNATPMLLVPLVNERVCDAIGGSDTLDES
mmetsp:Transcript_21452/g.57402  ORF Transcript_21452/g.57402 Transcript_21452/m.57402 type:complete len:84 (+) Transcript_21452:90-341(+)